MYIAMNRFRIAPGREEDFLEVWRNRDSHLDEVPGFKQFQMLQGESQEDHTVFISHSVWESEEAFRAWLSPSNFDAEGRQQERLSDLTRLVRSGSDPSLK